MPYITKTFDAATVPVGERVVVTFTIVNDDETPKTGVGFTDTLPANMVVHTPPGISNPDGIVGITAVEGSGSISVSGASLAGGEIVHFLLSLVILEPGVYENVTSDLQTTEDGVIADSSDMASITALESGFVPRWTLMRFDIKTREEEEA